MLFTRQPDYFDGEFTTGTIIRKGEKAAAIYFYNDKQFLARVPYGFLHNSGKKVTVIYEAADPSKGHIYNFFGYWIGFGELIASLVIVGFLYWIATTVTNNPTAEAVIEELEMGKKKPKKPKYDS